MLVCPRGVHRVGGAFRVVDCPCGAGLLFGTAPLGGVAEVGAPFRGVGVVPVIPRCWCCAGDSAALVLCRFKLFLKFVKHVVGRRDRKC